jgi:hypothetical protein
MKTIGIAIDNHRQAKFEEAIVRAGFSFTTSQLFASVKLIRIMVTPEEFEESCQQIAKICKTQQINFNRSN